MRLSMAVCVFARLFLCESEREVLPVSPNAQSSFEPLWQDQGVRVRAAMEGRTVHSRDADCNILLIPDAVYAKTADLDVLLAHGPGVNTANKADHTA